MCAAGIANIVTGQCLLCTSRACFCAATSIQLEVQIGARSSALIGRHVHSPHRASSPHEDQVCPLTSAIRIHRLSPMSPAASILMETGDRLDYYGHVVNQAGGCKLAGPVATPGHLKSNAKASPTRHQQRYSTSSWIPQVLILQSEHSWQQIASHSTLPVRNPHEAE